MKGITYKQTSNQRYAVIYEGEQVGEVFLHVWGWKYVGGRDEFFDTRKRAAEALVRAKRGGEPEV